MIAETGHFALCLALFLSLLQAWTGLRGATVSAQGQAARRMATALFALLTLAFAALAWGFAVTDLSLRVVATNADAAMPALYRVAAAWGHHEGSMLLWIWILSLWGAVAARARMPDDFRARVLGVQGLIAGGFLSFLLFASNPFARLDPPAAAGLGLNPILQDPSLALHPPMLYTGYVGFSIAFCFAMAGLIEGRVDRAWAARLRPWALWAWVALTAGIAKGALWAYYELGWGGFWFWDPVENASLMPWLAGTALIHALSVTASRGALVSWSVFLAILAFVFSLLGTFLVRSGVLSSVHAFAVDPLKGIFILGLLGLSAGGAFLLYALRAPKIAPGPALSATGREAALLLNNVFLSAFCVAVFLGTLYPVFMSALSLPDLSVGPPYYLTILTPMLAPFAALTVLGPLLRGRWAPALARLGVSALPAALCAVPFLDKPLGALGVFLGIWICCGTVAAAARRGPYPLPWVGMIAAHLGLGVLILGATASTQFGAEKIAWMSPGDRMHLGPREIAFLGLETEQADGHATLRGIFRLGTQEPPIFLTPERRWYKTAGQETAEVALRPSGLGLVYLALGEGDKKDQNRRVVRAYHHPLVLFVFGGGALMALGGALAAYGRRKGEVKHEA